MELLMANGPIGGIKPSLLQGFVHTPTNPISKIALQLKKKRILSRVDADKKGLGLVIQKQFEFEPSFDEYLKAMESVKSGREKTPVKDANFKENSTHKYVMRESEVEEGMDSTQEVVKVSKSSLGMRRKDRVAKVSEEDVSVEWESRDGSVENKNGRWTNGFSSQSNAVPRVTEDKIHRGSYRRTNAISDIDLTKRVLDEKSKHTNVEKNTPSLRGRQDKVVKGSGDMSTEWESREGDFDGSAKKTNRRWTNGFSSQSNAVERITEDKIHRGSYRKTNTISEVDLTNRVLDEKSKHMNVEKNAPSSNAARVGNTERATNFTGVSRWTREREQSCDTSIGSTTSESSLDRTLNNWERTSKGGSKTELGETHVWKNKSTTQRSDIDRQIHDYSFNERKSAYGVEKRGDPSYGRSNERLEVDRGYRHNEDTMSIKSRNFSKGAKFLEEGDEEGDMEMERAAFKSFEVFNDLRGQPRVLRMEMEERIQNLAKWLNGTDINLPEWLFSKMMHSARIRFSDHSILRVIQILGTLGNWRRVLQVIEWLETRERFKSYKSRYIYTTALDVLGKAKRPVEALNVFHAMRKGMSSYPDLAAYHCIAVTLGQAGYVKELFDVIDCMRSPPPTKFSTGYIEKWDPRLEPDIIIYNAVLNACARRKQWEGAFWVLQQLKEQGLQPSSTTYGLVMEVMLACEKYNLVYEFFKKVQKSTIPNTLNYKVLVNTLWKEGKTDDAVFAVKDMERRGIVGSASLYYDLARCLCSAGRCQEALMQMDNICKVARKPLVVTYTGLIQACLDAGNVQDGTYIFKQMQAFCSPNLVTFNIMLKAYLEHGMFEDAKDLFQKMLDESCHITRRSDYKSIVTPDSYTFNTMLEACAAEQKWDDFRYIFQEMLHRGYNFNTRRHLRMILDACRAGKGELLETTWKHLVHANRVPPPPLIKEMFCMKLEKNDYTAAITSITSHPTNDLQLHAFSEKGWLDLLKANTDRLQKDTIINLTHKLNVTVAGSDRPHPILQNLIYSCREFMESHVGGEINYEETRENISVS